MKGFWAFLALVGMAGTVQAGDYRQVVRTIVAAPVQYAPACGVQQSFSYGVQQAPAVQFAPSCGVQQQFGYGVQQQFGYGVQQRFIQRQFVPSYSAGLNFNIGVGRSRFFAPRRAFVPRQRVIVRQRVIRRR